MSAFTVRVSIQHEGQSVAGFPITRRVEGATHDAMPVDMRFPTAGVQQLSSGAPMAALRFEKSATVQLGVYTGTLTFSVGPNGIVVFMAADGMGFVPTAHSRIRGIV